MIAPSDLAASILALVSSTRCSAASLFPGSRAARSRMALARSRLEADSISTSLAGTSTGGVLVSEPPPKPPNWETSGNVDPEVGRGAPWLVEAWADWGIEVRSTMSEGDTGARPPLDTEGLLRGELLASAAARDLHRNLLMVGCGELLTILLERVEGPALPDMIAKFKENAKVLTR